MEMKNLIKLFTIVFICWFFFSCEKEYETHTIKYTVEFLQKPDNHETVNLAISNTSTSTQKPCYVGDRFLDVNTYSNYWEYEYSGLVRGGDVEFWVNLNYPGFLYVISVYIDGSLASSKKIYRGEDMYDNDTHSRDYIVEEGGLDDDDTDNKITFTY